MGKNDSKTISFLFSLVIDYVSVELVEIHFVVSVEIAILQQFIHEELVLVVFFLVGFEDDLQFFFGYFAIVVEIEVVERKFEVVFVVGCRFGEAGRDEFIVGEATVVIDIHRLDYVFDLVQLRLLIILLEIFTELLDCEAAVFILIDFKKHLP